MKFKFPAVKGNKFCFPEKTICPWCKKNKTLEPHSFAYITGGACLMNRKKDSGGPDDRMDGFLRFSWHGAHDVGIGKDRDICVDVSIADDVIGGQYDILFCSTKCLRAFLNCCVDELEKKISNEKSRSN